MRVVNNGFTGGQTLANYLNNASNQDNLISIMNKNAGQKQKLTFTPNISPVAAGIINNKNQGIYDPVTGTWSSSGNQSVALKNLEDRQTYNQLIKDALANEGIKLSAGDKLTLTFDKDGQVSVSGISDQTKKAKIEATLNNALKDDSTGLMMHILSVKSMNGQEIPEILTKWMVYDFIKEQAGQDISELKLVDGVITGANEKLQEILDGKVDFGDNSEYAQEILSKLKSVLAAGTDKIPDMELSIDYQNGSLVDIGVDNGFGPAQLSTWFAGFISGKSTWNFQA